MRGRRSVDTPVGPVGSVGSVGSVCRAPASIPVLVLGLVPLVRLLVRLLLGLLLGLVLVLVLTGCQTLSAGEGGHGSSTPDRTPSSLLPVSGFGTVFLAVGECSSFGSTSFTEVPCTGERAAARVVARHEGAVGAGPLCPPTTDFVLHIGEQPAAGGAGSIPQGYACMRTLQPPHPGDPGAGGGPRTIVGDCVYGVGGGQVRETPCDGSGAKKPQYEVVKAVDARAHCPASTALYVHLGDDTHPVGCARPM